MSVLKRAWSVGWEDAGDYRIGTAANEKQYLPSRQPDYQPSSLEGLQSPGIQSTQTIVAYLNQSQQSVKSLD